jgi:radical SAM protein with 4Fe4S-binding SPASM domain
MDRKIGYMDFGLFQKIVDDAAENGVKRIHLYLHGEPLLHPQLIDMIRHVKSSGIGVTIATNGMPLDARKIETLMHTRMNNADHIIFSVLGYSKEVHEKVMKGVNHEKVLKNIQDILQWREILNMNGPIIETVMYIMPENKNEEAQFNKYWRGIVDHVRRVGNISEQFAKHKKEDNSIPSRNKTCKNLWERMTIFWNGDVTICCADLDGNYVLGNLKEKSIRDIWNSNQLLLIRKFHKEKNFKKIPFCLKCDWP